MNPKTEQILNDLYETSIALADTFRELGLPRQAEQAREYYNNVVSIVEITEICNKHPLKLVA